MTKLQLRGRGNNMSYIPIQIVDEDDQPLGPASKHEAWEKGLLHRIVSILVENKDGQLLLQKRGPLVAISPDIWDSSAAGHVD